jgi:hypothetical protein
MSAARFGHQAVVVSGLPNVNVYNGLRKRTRMTVLKYGGGGGDDDDDGPATINIFIMIMIIFILVFI